MNPNDRYLRFLLSVAVLSLAVIALRGIVPDARAAAGDPMKCEIVGTVKIAMETFGSPILVKGSDDFRVSIRDTVPVKVERIDSTVNVKQN